MGQALSVFGFGIDALTLERQSLIEACQMEDVDTVRVHLEKGVSALTTDSDGESLLFLTISANNDSAALEMTQLLLHFGADSSSVLPDRNTCLHVACSMRRDRIVKELLKYNVSVNAKNSLGETALIISVTAFDLRSTQLLLEHSAEVNMTDYSGLTPLHYACRTRGNVRVVKLLLQHSASVNKADERGWSALHVAAQTPDTEILGILLAHNAFPDLAAVDGQTPLHRACTLGYQNNARILLENDADTDVTDIAGLTPLHRAASGGHVQTVEILMKHGAYVDSIDARSWTVLHRACAAKDSNIEVIKLLLDNGADANLLDEYDHAPIYLACKNWFHDRAFVLVEHGVCIDATRQRRNRDSVLHILCKQILLTQDNFEKTKQLIILRLFCKIIALCREVDMTNSAGETAYSLWERCMYEAYMVSQTCQNTSVIGHCDTLLEVIDKMMISKYYFNLQCLAARSISKHRISYSGILPTALVEFVERHQTAFSW